MTASVSGLALCCAVGCGSLDVTKNKSGLFSGAPLLAPSTEGSSIDGLKGPMERKLAASARTENSVSMENAAGFGEYQNAKTLYDQEQYAAAEKAFKKVADTHAVDETGFFRKRKFKNLLTPRSQLEANYYDNPLVEDSLFMLAESRYQQRKLPGAQDVYLQLMKQYPNSRHIDTCSKRLFDIALTWMQFKSTTSNDVQLAAHSDTGPSTKPQVVQNKDYERPGFFNLSSKERPLTDTEGRALEALRAIWMNDPTGPLADDAVMLTASHYLRVGRYSDAAEVFRTLREDFPNSPHVNDAYILGSYVTQASYQGADYDSKNLHEARALKETALRMFANLTPEDRARLQEELVKVDDALVGKEFSRALFYLNKGQFEAVEMVCHHIINQYPESKYAGKARGLLEMMPKLKKQSTLYLAMQRLTVDDIPSVDEAPSNGVLPERPELPYQNTITPTPSAPESQEKAPQAPRYLPTLEMPKLKPVPLPRLWPEKPAQPESAPSFQNQPEQQNDTGRVNLTLGTDE